MECPKTPILSKRQQKTIKEEKPGDKAKDDQVKHL
jgi:hypothetical protein